MSTVFDASAIARHGWRQGAVLGSRLADEVRKHAPSGIAFADNALDLDAPGGDVEGAPGAARHVLGGSGPPPSPAAPRGRRRRVVGGHQAQVRGMAGRVHDTRLRVRQALPPGKGRAGPNAAGFPEDPFAFAREAMPRARRRPSPPARLPPRPHTASSMFGSSSTFTTGCRRSYASSRARSSPYSAESRWATRSMIRSTRFDVIAPSSAVDDAQFGRAARWFA